MLRGSMPMRDVWYSQFLIFMRRWPYVVLCLLIYTVFVIVLAMLNRADSLFSSTYLVLGLIVMPGILPLSLLMVCLRLRRDSQRRVGLFAVTESALTQEGIEAAIGGDKVSLKWDAFREFISSQHVVVLFLRDNNAHLIVSRAKLSNPEDWLVLLAFLHERLPRC